MLAEKLYNLNSFQRQYEVLQVLSVCDPIPNLIWKEEKESLYKKIDWNNMLGIASGLVYSDKNEHLDAALRIAQAALQQEQLREFQKNAAAAILISLTNNPAIRLAIKRNLIHPNFEENLPFSIKMNINKWKFENSIVLDDEILELNRFQNDVYKSAKQFDAISISAPTSAGKSFILCSVIIDELLKGQRNIIYVVPTRALISQVESDLREPLLKYKLNVNLSTVPQDISEGQTSSLSNVLIFTQERLHWFLAENHSLKIDVIVVDEAHKIEDGYRGILLQQKLEEVFEANSTIKIFFSSPFTSNPEILLDTISNDISKKPIVTQFVSVNQNLIYISQYPGLTTKWVLKLCLPEKTIELGFLNLIDRPVNEKKKVSFIASEFSSGGSGNLIYANGPAEAEEVALALFDCVIETSQADEIVELIKLVQKTVHKDYRLGKVLKKGIAFHYGNMPLLIRQEIEKLFKEGKIKYLICTSTLLEGVNLPAKSIFIRKPRRGKSTPLNQNDFWNLAGRAGRWGKEFSGNIVCIEPTKWDIPPNPNKSKQRISFALSKVSENEKELIDYINLGTPRIDAETNQNLEFAFGYYYSLFLAGKLEPINSLTQALLPLFTEIRKVIRIPDNIIRRNPGISPLAQQQLLDYFYERIDTPEKLVPVYPEDDDAYNQYASLIGRIGKTLSHYPYQLNNSRSILIINWISGKPLSYIIRESYRSYQSNPNYKNKTIHIVIREVMDNVENFARFRFAKDSSCYVDVLRFFLKDIGREDLLENIPQLNLWLEFGVSQKTHLSLLSIGLTRNTVVELSQYIADTNMNKEEAFSWLKNQDLSKYDLSPIVMEDVELKLNIAIK